MVSRNLTQPVLGFDEHEGGLIVELLLVENAWRQKESWSFMQLQVVGEIDTNRLLFNQSRHDG